MSQSMSLWEYTYNRMVEIEGQAAADAWHQQRLAEQKFAGQEIDFTTMQVGDEWFGETIATCPKCKRNGLVYEQAGITSHKEKIISGIASLSLDECKFTK